MFRRPLQVIAPVIVDGHASSLGLPSSGRGRATNLRLPGPIAAEHASLHPSWWWCAPSIFWAHGHSITVPKGGGHWGLARCRRSQEARRRRGRLRLRRESNGQLSKDPFRRCQNVGPGMICKEKARSTSPHESGWPSTPGRLHREFRSEGNWTVISGRYDDGSGKRSPKESLCGHYRLRLPLVPLVPLANMNWARCAPPPATHSATPSLLEIVTSRMHFDSITHPHYLASLSSVATGLLRPCPVTRRAVPSSMSQEGQDLLTDDKRRPSGPGARNPGEPGEPGSRRNTHMSGTQKILPVPRWHAIL